jgi:hypothetical protein
LPDASAEDPETQRLLHELQAHKIKLEEQNNKLIATIDDLQPGHERYWAMINDFNGFMYILGQC